MVSELEAYLAWFWIYRFSVATLVFFHRRPDQQCVVIWRPPLCIATWWFLLLLQNSVVVVPIAFWGPAVASCCHLWSFAVAFCCSSWWLLSDRFGSSPCCLMCGFSLASGSMPGWIGTSCIVCPEVLIHSAYPGGIGLSSGAVSFVRPILVRCACQAFVICCFYSLRFFLYPVCEGCRFWWCLEVCFLVFCLFSWLRTKWNYILLMKVPKHKIFQFNLPLFV